MTDDIESNRPGKEWRITTPEHVDELKLLQGEIALRAIADVMGWDFKEIEKQTETELTSAEILETSKETFGTESYGEFALEYLDWMRYGAKAEVVLIGDNQHISFAHSAFHNRFPTFEERLPVDRYASGRDMKRVIREEFDTIPFPFTHTVHFHPRYAHTYKHAMYGNGYHVASIVPDVMTRERMSNFLRTPQREGAIALADHELHGVIGRAFDVLCLASGVKETVDIAATEARFEPVPLDEFLPFAEREGVSKGKLQTLRTKLENAFRRQLFTGKADPWGEVVAEGRPKLYYGNMGGGFRTIRLDTISPSTLLAVRGSYEKISPELEAVLAIYE